MNSTSSTPESVPVPDSLVFAYGRVSKRAVGGVSPQQLSIELQDKDLREYAARQNIPLDHLQVFLERHSGSFEFGDILKRREGPKLISAIREARAKYPTATVHLFFTKVDRVGRGFLETQLLFREFREKLRVKVHIIELGGKSFDCESMEGQLIVAILAWVAETEVRNTQKRIMRALDGLRESGYLTGTVSYGWNATPTGETNAKGKPRFKRVANPEEQKWILQMNRLRQAGWGYHSIAKDLNARNVPTKHRAGEIMKLRTANDGPAETRFVSGNWQAGNVAKILKSRTVQAWLASQPSQKAD